MIARLLSELLSHLPVGWYRFPMTGLPTFSSCGHFGCRPGDRRCAGSVLALSEMLLPPLVGAVALLALALLSGAMHEDGLADMADGFGGGRDVESKVGIMHDSRIGSYGVMALILSSAARLGC